MRRASSGVRSPPLVGHRAHEVAAHLLTRASLGTRGVDPVLRVPDELVDEGGRGTEHAEDALAPDARAPRARPRGRRCPSRAASPETGERLRDPHQPEQALVGVGGVAHDGGQGVELAVGDSRADRQQRAVVDEPDGRGRGRRSRAGRGPPRSCWCVMTSVSNRSVVVGPRHGRGPSEPRQVAVELEAADLVAVVEPLLRACCAGRSRRRARRGCRRRARSPP